MQACAAGQRIKDTITSTGGRAPSSQNTRRLCGGSRSPGATRGSPAQAPSFGPSNDPPDHLIASRTTRTVGDISRNTRPLAAVDFCLLHPLIQRMRGTADLRGDRHDRLPAGTVLAVRHWARSNGASMAHLPSTRRTARSQTSGEYLFVVLFIMASFYSGVEASGKPGAVQSERKTRRSKAMKTCWFSSPSSQHTCRSRPMGTRARRPRSVATKRKFN